MKTTPELKTTAAKRPVAALPSTDRATEIARILSGNNRVTLATLVEILDLALQDGMFSAVESER